MLSFGLRRDILTGSNREDAQLEGFKCTYTNGTYKKEVVYSI